MSDATALPSSTYAGKVALYTDADREGVSYLTPAKARALAGDLEQAAFDVEQGVSAPAAPEVVGGGAESCTEHGCSFGRVPIGDGLGDCPKCSPAPVAAAAPGDDEAALVSLIAVEIYGGSELTDDEAGTLAVRIVRLTQERFTLTKRSAT